MNTTDLNRKIRFIEADIVFVMKLFLAFILIVIGIIGVLLPIIPDWPLIIIGIILMDAHGNARRKMISWIPAKYQKKATNILFWHRKERR
jgi:uncharacterized membrane protein YbaN (DUF454 family)